MNMTVANLPEMMMQRPASNRPDGADISFATRGTVGQVQLIYWMPNEMPSPFSTQSCSGSDSPQEKAPDMRSGYPNHSRLGSREGILSTSDLLLLTTCYCR
jgi:hypothetical protein